MNIAGTTTNIGSIYLQLGEYAIARDYYEKGLQLFELIELSGGQAHALFKLGLLDMELENYDLAKTELTRSLDFQQDVKEPTGQSRVLFLSETYINIGKVYLLSGDLEEAERYLLEGYGLAMDENSFELIALAAENLSMVYKTRREYDLSLDYYVVFKQYSDSLFNDGNVKKITQLEMQHQFDTKMKEEELKREVEDQRRKRESLTYIGISVGLLLILVIVMLLLLLEKNKKKKLEADRKLLQEKLDHANKELTTYVMYLLRKNEFILSIIEKLKKARLDASAENKKVIAEMISELKSNTDTISWEEFEVRFQQVHTEFYTNLRNKFPDLSNNEIRLCAFFRLNMTSKEIAAITYQSLNSLKVARYRLRKKLNLSQEENLISFLSSF
jgi:tetratricopeptide (TPR) repeat protein